VPAFTLAAGTVQSNPETDAVAVKVPPPVEREIEEPVEALPLEPS
jgi:hypothetical protein